MKADMVSADISGQLPSGVTANFVKKIINLAYRSAAGCRAVQVDVSIVNDQEMQRLNRLYRGVNSTTDVLSFSYIDDSNIFIDATDETTPPLLGEIVISSEQICRQAAEKKRKIPQEFALMLVHGVLHLMGYDHVTTQGEVEMFSLQQRIMDLINRE